MDNINRDPNLLRGHRLLYIYSDCHMDVRETIRVMTKQRDAGVVAFVGPEEQCRTEATVAAAWNIPMISYVSGRIARGQHSG